MNNSLNNFRFRLPTTYHFHDFHDNQFCFYLMLKLIFTKSLKIWKNWGFNDENIKYWFTFQIYVWKFILINNQSYLRMLVLLPEMRIDSIKLVNYFNCSLKFNYFCNFSSLHSFHHEINILMQNKSNDF